MNLDKRQQKIVLMYSSVYSSIMITFIFIGACILTAKLYPTITHLDTMMGKVNEYIYTEKVLSSDIQQIVREGHNIYEEIDIFLANHTKLIDADLKKFNF